MFEAKLAQSSLLKKVLDALKEIVEDTNLECSSSGQPSSAGCQRGWGATESPPAMIPPGDFKTGQLEHVHNGRWGIGRPDSILGELYTFQPDSCLFHILPF